ncbi:MAG: hypothetical protein HY420_02805 [Candidatus Kerfeldbacteria bacterium]|nr:hypothetical protein [Candidatus Kerfeldbacteria bacterium]
MTQRGATIVEMLVGVSVLLLVGGIAISIYLSSSQFTKSEQLRIDVDVSASRVLTLLDRYLRQGSVIEDQYPLTGSPTYTTSDTTLVFSLPSIVSGAPDPLKKDTAALYVQSGELKLLIDADPASSRSDTTLDVTKNVRDVYFRYTAGVPSAAKSFTVTVTTEKTISGVTYTQASILNETLRNHP